MRRGWVCLFLGLCILLCIVAEAKESDLERIAYDDIKALSFYDGKITTSRRKPPIPQLTCEGELCKKLKVRVIQCIHRGDEQWRCEAQLPLYANLGAVHVSCEGWDNANDKYIVKGSCGLTYELIPQNEPGQRSWGGFLFLVVFWTFAIFILLSFLHTCLGKEVAPTPVSDPGTGAPPPYKASQGPTFTSPVSRFFTAIGLGAVAGYLFSSRPVGQRETMDEQYRPFPAYGTMPHHGVYYGDAATQLGSQHTTSSSTHTSTGYGDSDNR